MSPSHLKSNIEAICKQAPLKVPRKWANIKSISIKTTSSVALPVYNKTLEELEQIKSMADIGVNVDAVREEKDQTLEKMEQEKKRKEMADKSPLARALKKQKSAKKDTSQDEVEMLIKTPKSKAKESNDGKTKSSKKRKEKVEDEDDQTKEEAVSKTPKEKKVKSSTESVKSKSSKKTKENDSENKPKTPSKKADAELNPKSSKKVTPSDQVVSTENASFIPSKKYTGSKKGYVFRKDKQGLGYYRDVLPVVDKVWLAKLKSGKAGGGGGGRKSIGHTPKKKRGNSRRSY